MLTCTYACLSVCLSVCNIEIFLLSIRAHTCNDALHECIHAYVYALYVSTVYKHSQSPPTSCGPLEPQILASHITTTITNITPIRLQFSRCAQGFSGAEKGLLDPAVCASRTAGLSHLHWKKRERGGQYESERKERSVK